MGKFYEHLSIKGRIGRPDGALLRITGDRNIPLMNALLGLYVEHPETLASSCRTAAMRPPASSWIAALI